MREILLARSLALSVAALLSDCQTVGPDGLKTDGLTDWLTD